MYTIGLLIDYLEMSYANKIIQGSIRGAKERNVNLIVYPGSAVNEDRSFSLDQVGSDRYSGKTTFHRTVLYEFARKNHLDGMILSLATVGAYLSDEEMEEFVRSFPMPIVLLEKQMKGYSSITFSDNGIELAMTHLIKDCGRTCIGYVSGPLNNEDAVQRFEAYKRVLQDNRMQCRQDWIAYGDFSPFCEEPIRELIEKHHNELDAICVANDAMCIPVYKYIQECGLTPGKEIAVTGYDNTDIAVDSKPQLTSVNANAESLGYEAIRSILNLIMQQQVKIDKLPVELKVRASTGSTNIENETLQPEMQSTGLHNQNSLKNVYINSIASDMLMHSNDINAAAKSACYNLSHAGIDEFYIYLYENSFVHERGSTWNLPERMERYITYNEKTNVSIVGDGQMFSVDDIMREELAGDQQRIMAAFPIEVMGEHYGLIYMSYHSELCMDVFSIANQFATVFYINNLILQLKHATEAKSNFLANMSHEIRTPLNAVLGMNEMILRESNEDAVLSYASYIERSGKTLLTLINEILDLSKIESGKMEIVPVEYDTTNIFMDLYNMIQPRAEKKGLEFRMELDEKLPSKLYGDDVRIRQIITNLLTNAVKYTEKGSVVFKVEEQYADEEQVSLLVSVEDSGIGIRVEDREKLFSDYQRLDQEKNRNIEGTGLGLGITIRFLEMMESRLQVESVYGEGSTFFFVLQQRIVEDTPIGKVSLNNDTKTIDEHGRGTQITAPEAKVLVVDDNDMNRVVATSLLKDTKVQLDTLENGMACLESVQIKDYDIIFLDHMMPDMDGIETVQRLHTYWKEKNKKAPPVIILTANAIAGAKEMYLEKGFDDYLSKPIDAQKLENMLVKYLPENYIIEEERTRKTKISEQAIWDSIAGIDMHEAMSHNPDREAFLQLLELFYDGIDTKASEIESYEKQERIKDFTIQVHALKSSARMIGATVVSELAAELENAGNQMDVEKIHQDTGLMLGIYRKYKDFLGGLFESKISSEDISIEELIHHVNSIREAMENFDLDKADAEMAHIKKLNIPSDLEEEFNVLKDGVLNFRIEETVETAKILCDKMSKLGTC